VLLLPVRVGGVRVARRVQGSGHYMSPDSAEAAAKDDQEEERFAPAGGGDFSQRPQRFSPP